MKKEINATFKYYTTLINTKMVLKSTFLQRVRFCFWKSPFCWNTLTCPFCGSKLKQVGFHEEFITGCFTHYVCSKSDCKFNEVED